MSLMKKRPVDSSPESTVILNADPVIQPDTYSSIVVDTVENPVSKMLGYAEGYPWIIDYFQQVVTKDTDVRVQDYTQSGVYQQYNKINQLEIRVDSPLSSNQNSNTNAMEVTGSGFIYAPVIPNAGDMFVGDAGFGQRGIFAINAVERRTIYKQSAYAIKYVQVANIDSNPERLTDLNTKVISEYYFDKSLLSQGLPAVIQTKEFEYRINLKDKYSELCKYYFKTFYKKDYGTLVLPGQKTGIYDPFLVNFILKIVDTFDAFEIRSIRNFKTDDDPYLEQCQFWKVLENRDISLLPSCCTQMGLVNTRQFNPNSMFKGFRFSTLSYVVYPIDVDTSLVDKDQYTISGDHIFNGINAFIDEVPVITHVYKELSDKEITPVSRQSQLIDQIVNNTYTIQNSNVNIINSFLNEDQTYVFTRELL